MQMLLLNVFRQKLFLVSILLSLLICFFIYKSLYQFKLINDHENIFTISLIISFLLIVIIFFIILKNIFFILNQIILVNAGEEFRKKTL